MTPSEKIKSILKILNSKEEKPKKVELATVTAVDGTVLSYETLEAGQQVFVVQGDTSLPAPVGEYVLEDGRVIVVSEEGIIAEVRGETVTTTLSEEQKTEMKNLIRETLKEIQKEDMQTFVDSLQADIDTMLSAQKTELEAKLSEKDAKIEELETKLNAMPASAGINFSPSGKEVEPLPAHNPSELSKMSARERVNHLLFGGEADA